ncbi:conserved protein of unknown function [Methylocaldum szegediense]|uniref:Uncharacterized protein n=1 Tax=Methylocaldum szegediense TaxID=73780 RepID=A0ABM9I3L0_9GAMM|nr:conserved protein of unknown function [Methylocaldum szegediense]
MTSVEIFLALVFFGTTGGAIGFCLKNYERINKNDGQ